jgi:hypothetical protein
MVSHLPSFPLPARERMKVRVLLQRVLLTRDSRFRLCSDTACVRLPLLPLAALMLALCGCARVAQPALAPRPVIVKIPVATPIYCAVPVLEHPPLAIAALTEDSPPADTIRSYAATVDVLKSAVLQRDAILKGCGAPAGDAAATAGIEEGGPSPAPSARPLPDRERQGSSAEPSNPPANNFTAAAGALLSRLRGWVPW